MPIQPTPPRRRRSRPRLTRDLLAYYQPVTVISVYLASADTVHVELDLPATVRGTDLAGLAIGPAGGAARPTPSISQGAPKILVLQNVTGAAVGDVLTISAPIAALSRLLNFGSYPVDPL